MKVQRNLSAKRRPRLTAHCTVVVTRATDDANTPEEIRAWMESTLGANGWVRVYDECVVTVVPSEDETRAERIAAALIQTLTDKYADGVRSVWTPTPGFLMPEAIEAGSLPPVVSEITELLRLED